MVGVNVVSFFETAVSVLMQPFLIVDFLSLRVDANVLEEIGRDKIRFSDNKASGPSNNLKFLTLLVNWFL